MVAGTPSALSAAAELAPDEPASVAVAVPAVRAQTTIRRAVFVAAVGAALLYSEVGDFSGEVAMVLPPFILAIALCFLPLLWRDDPDPFELSAFTGVYIGVGLTSSVMAILQNGKVDLSYIPQLSQRTKSELVATVVWSYVVAQASYLVGYYAPRRKSSNVSRLVGLEWSHQRLVLVCLACMTIAVPVYVWFQNRLGTDLSDVTELAKGKAVWRDDRDQTWVLRGISIGFLPAMLGLALALKTRSRAGLLAALVLIAVESVLAVRTGQRGLAVIFLLICGAIYHYMRRRLPLSLLFVIGFAGIVASNTLIQYRVNDADAVQTRSIEQRLNVAQQLQEHAEDRQRLSAMAVIFYYFPEKQDFLFGESWLGLIALPIPKWVWSAKTDAFVWRDSAIVYHFVGESVPTPFHGVLFANFSWFGVVLGMAAWGRAQRRIYDWAMAARGDPNVTLLYASILFVMSPMLAALSLTTQFFFPMLAIVLFIGYRSRVAALAPLRAK